MLGLPLIQHVNNVPIWNKISFRSSKSLTSQTLGSMCAATYKLPLILYTIQFVLKSVKIVQVVKTVKI